MIRRLTMTPMFAAGMALAACNATPNPADELLSQGNTLRIAAWNIEHLAGELLPGNRTLTLATIWALLIFDDEEIADVETQAAFAGVQGQGGA